MSGDDWKGCKIGTADRFPTPAVLSNTPRIFTRLLPRRWRVRTLDPYIDPHTAGWRSGISSGSALRSVLWRCEYQAERRRGRPPGRHNVFPVEVFIRYASGISLVEGPRRQRDARPALYREAWRQIAEWAPRGETLARSPVKFGEASARRGGGNPEPSPGAFALNAVGEGVET